MQRLVSGGVGTGARGGAAAIIVDLEGLVPRIVGGGGVAYRLPNGLRIIGRGGRGLTWWFNTEAKGEITRIIDFIRQGFRSY